MKLSKKLISYIIFIFVIACFMLYYLIANYGDINISHLIIWSILVIITESLLVELPNRQAAVSVGTALSVVAIMDQGPFLASMATAIGFIFRMPYISGKGRIHLFNTPFYKTVFNVSQAIIINGFAGLLYLTLTQNKLQQFDLLIMVLVILLYEILNALIMAGLMSFVLNKSFLKILFQYIKDVCINSFGIGLIGVLIALAYFNYGFGAVILFFAPLLLARYTFKLYMDMRNIYFDTIQALNKALEIKDPYTSGHSKRVEEYAVKLAKGIKLPQQRIDIISKAALLHDIGKIGVPDEILNKKGPLTVVEYEQIKQHPDIGADILTNVKFLKEIATIIRQHHERYDGKGYPNHLKGKNISKESCILSIADVYDAMTSDRPYKKGLSKDQAIQELKNNAGTQFNPELVDIFVKMLIEE